MREGDHAPIDEPNQCGRIDPFKLAFWVQELLSGIDRAKGHVLTSGLFEKLQRHDQHLQGN
jgi:hypothetical protein